MKNFFEQEMKEHVKAKCKTIFLLTGIVCLSEGMHRAYLYLNVPVNFPQSHDIQHFLQSIKVTLY
jgi:hypothetical protein